MIHLKPDETDLRCEWNFVAGKMIGNDVCDRIAFLIKHHLKKVAGGGWETLYVDPNDSRYWERTYRKGEMHGGGLPRLAVLSKEQAEAKYGKLSALIEKQEKWEPINGIETPAASALVSENREGLKVTLLFSKIADGNKADLCIQFGRVLAYTVYEEFVHPWETSEAAPRLTGRWETHIYPLLQIKDSEWIATLPNLLFVHPDAMHYRLLTLDKIVDVLCSKLPDVIWIGQHDGP